MNREKNLSKHGHFLLVFAAKNWFSSAPEEEYVGPICATVASEGRRADENRPNAERWITINKIYFRLCIEHFLHHGLP